MLFKNNPDLSKKLNLDQVTDADIRIAVIFEINDYSALVSKFEAEEVFKDELSDDLVQNVATFMMTGMPSEVVMKMWSLLGQTGGDEQKNLLKIHQISVDGRTFSDFLVEMLGGEEK